MSSSVSSSSSSSSSSSQPFVKVDELNSNEENPSLTPTSKKTHTLTLSSSLSSSSSLCSSVRSSLTMSPPTKSRHHVPITNRLVPIPYLPSSSFSSSLFETSEYHSQYDSLYDHYVSADSSHHQSTICTNNMNNIKPYEPVRRNCNTTFPRSQSLNIVGNHKPLDKNQTLEAIPANSTTTRIGERKRFLSFNDSKSTHSQVSCRASASSFWEGPLVQIQPLHLHLESARTTPDAPLTIKRNSYTEYTLAATKRKTGVPILPHRSVARRVQSETTMTFSNNIDNNNCKSVDENTSTYLYKRPQDTSRNNIIPSNYSDSHNTSFQYLPTPLTATTTTTTTAPTLATTCMTEMSNSEMDPVLKLREIETNHIPLENQLQLPSSSSLSGGRRSVTEAVTNVAINTIVSPVKPRKLNFLPQTLKCSSVSMISSPSSDNDSKILYHNRLTCSDNHKTEIITKDYMKGQVEENNETIKSTMSDSVIIAEAMSAIKTTTATSHFHRNKKNYDGGMKLGEKRIINDGKDCKTPITKREPESMMLTSTTAILRQRRLRRTSSGMSKNNCGNSKGGIDSNVLLQRWSSTTSVIKPNTFGNVPRSNMIITLVSLIVMITKMMIYLFFSILSKCRSRQYKVKPQYVNNHHPSSSPSTVSSSLGTKLSIYQHNSSFQTLKPKNEKRHRIIIFHGWGVVVAVVVVIISAVGIGLIVGFSTLYHKYSLMQHQIQRKLPEQQIMVKTRSPFDTAYEKSSSIPNTKASLLSSISNNQPLVSIEPRKTATIQVTEDVDNKHEKKKNRQNINDINDIISYNVPWTIYYNVYVSADPFIAAIDRSIIEEQLEQIGMSYANMYNNHLNFTSSSDKHNSNKQYFLRLYYNTIGHQLDHIWFEQTICWNKYKIRCIHMDHYEKATEIVTLQPLHDHCRQLPSSSPSSDIVIYLHNKGSFHPTLNGQHRWRRTMTAAVTSNLCLDALRVQTREFKSISNSSNHESSTTCNACGMLFQPLPAPHFPGNMWSAKCSYVRDLVPLSEYGAIQQTTLKAWIEYETSVVGTLSKQPMFPMEDHFVGRGRYLAEHWLGSHPRLHPCDVSITSSKDYWLLDDHNFSEQFELEYNAPRNPYTDPEWDWYGYTNKNTNAETTNPTSKRGHHFPFQHHSAVTSETSHRQKMMQWENGNVTINDPMKRLRDYYLFRGMLFKWLALYGPHQIRTMHVDTTDFEIKKKTGDMTSVTINSQSQTTEEGSSKRISNFRISDLFGNDNDSHIPHDLTSCCIPDHNSWVWKWYPDGDLWKAAVSMYGLLGALNRLAVVPIVGHMDAEHNPTSTSSISSAASTNENVYQFTSDDVKNDDHYYYFLNLTLDEYDFFGTFLDSNQDGDQKILTQQTDSITTSSSINDSKLSDLVSRQKTSHMNGKDARTGIPTVISTLVQPFQLKMKAISKRRQDRMKQRNVPSMTPKVTNSYQSYVTAFVNRKRRTNKASLSSTDGKLLIVADTLTEGLRLLDPILFEYWKANVNHYDNRLI